jgi:hypothetical protein
MPNIGQNSMPNNSQSDSKFWRDFSNYLASSFPRYFGAAGSRSFAARKEPARIGHDKLSPITDLTLTGASWKTRVAADPYFVWSQASGLTLDSAIEVTWFDYFF